MTTKNHGYPPEGFEFLKSASSIACEARIMRAGAQEAIARARQIRQKVAAIWVQMAHDDPAFHVRYGQTLLESVVKTAMEITGAGQANVQVFDRPTRSLRIEAQYGFDSPFLKFFGCVHDGHAACGTALERRERVIVEDVTASPIFRGTPALEVLLNAGVRAVQSTPLVSPSGSVLGILSTHWCLPWRPSRRELFRLDLLARSAAEWLEQKESYRSVQHSSQSVTGRA